MPFTVRQSSIHGRGCFARKPLPAGAVIGRFEGEPTTENGDHVLWFGEDDAIVVTNELRYLNHAENPNAEVSDGLELVAVREIAPGEEITIDYGPDWA